MNRLFPAMAMAVACSLWPAQPVQAASEASATVSGLTFTLVDLTPDDGVAPSFSFMKASGNTSTLLSLKDDALLEKSAWSAASRGTYSFARDEWLSIAHAQAHVSAADQTLFVSGEASGPGTSFNATLTTGVNLVYYYPSAPVNLSLAANSALLIDVHYELTASASHPSACSDSSCPSAEKAGARLMSSLVYGYQDSEGWIDRQDNQMRTLQALARGAFPAVYYAYDPVLGYSVPVTTVIPAVEDHKQQSGALRTVFTNSSDDTQSAAWQVSISAWGTASTAAVPEVGTAWMCALGLAVMTLMRRQRTPGALL